MTDLHNLHDQEKEMLIFISRILKENNIRWWLLGGSVLGAVRHSGFIPWDDDVDIAVMRSDISAVEKILSEQQKLYIYKKTEDNYKPPIGKLYYFENRNQSEICPVIDIFALDKVPDGKLPAKVQRFFANVYHASILRSKAENRGIIARLITSIIFFVLPNPILDLLKNISKKVITRWNNKETAHIGNLFGRWGVKEIFDRSMFIGCSTGIFEGTEIPLPVFPDNYLKQLYGNYMELPPIEKRVPPH